MADQFCCDRIIAGRVHISQGDQVYEPMEGSVTMKPSRVIRTPGVSASGRMFITQTAKSQSAAFTLLNFCDKRPNRFWENNCPVDITIVEEDRNIRHHFTHASITGDPSYDLNTGQVTGMEIHTDQYVEG